MFLVAPARSSTRSLRLSQSCRSDFSAAEFECRRSGTGSFVFRVQLPGLFLSLSTFCTLRPTTPRPTPTPMCQRSWRFLFTMSTIWSSEDIFAVSAISPKLLSNLHVRGKWIIASPLSSRHMRVVVTQLRLFFFKWEVVSLWLLKLLPCKISILLFIKFFLPFTHLTCFLFCSFPFIKAAFTRHTSFIPWGAAGADVLA